MLALLAAIEVVAGCNRSGVSPADEVVLAQVDTLVSLESELLAAPSDMAVDEAGRLYVLDFQLAGVQVIPGPQQPTRFFGGPGQGPGEFDGPATLSVARDTVRVVEVGNGRIQVMDTAGVYHRSYTLPADFLGGIALSPAGLMAVPTQGFRDSALVRLFDRDGKPAGRLGELVVPPHQMWDMTAITTAIRDGQVPNALRNFSLPVMEDDGSLWLILNAEGVVRRHDGAGALLWSLTLQVPELAATRDDFFARNRALQAPGFVALQYVTDAVAAGGNLWLLLNTPTADPCVVLVVDAEGRVAKRFTLPGVHDAEDLAVDLDRSRLYLTIPSSASLVAAELPR
jgi:hypothetical protein